jgi:hypothetical protein
VEKTLLAKLPAKTKRTIYLCKQALPSSALCLALCSELLVRVWVRCILCAVFCACL